VNDEARKEKKLYYASLMKEAKEREKELALKYRDRAKERRETDKNPSDPDYVSTTSNFRAVAPGFSLTDNAERRRQIIEESKYLGGDLEHTHLVKGLDYAL
jgi:IK cytokine